MRLSGLAGAERVRFVEMPRVEMSSSLIRRRVAAGQPIRYLVPDRVANCIGARGLYGRPADAGAREAVTPS